MKTVTRSDVLKYVLLPQVRPRMGALFGSGFQFIPYFIALVFRCVRLLPQGHIYLQPNNIGRYGLRHVIAEAANHLVFNIKNIDQILLFFMVLAGLVLSAVQLFLLGLAMFVQPVLAAAAANSAQVVEERGFSGFFLTPDSSSTQDLSYMMLDLVFGVPGMFGSCIAKDVACLNIDGEQMATDAGQGIFSTEAWPYPMHEALHQMLTVYSMGLLIVAVIITLYFMITIVAETAQTGTAFGKRFNKVWAPIRIVVAFGLLVPISYGLNTAQYTVLYAAKFGTGFATNGWILFNETLTERYLGDVQKLVAEPNAPEIGELLRFMFVSNSCYEADIILYANERQGGPADRRPNIQPYVVKDIFTDPLLIGPGTSYQGDLLPWLEGDNTAIIRFGIRDKAENPLWKGFVKPICGEINFLLTDTRIQGGEPGVAVLQEFYFNMIRDMFWKMPSMMGGENYPRNYAINNISTGQDGLPELPADVRVGMYEQLKQQFETVITEAVEKQEEAGRWSVDENLRQKGWAAASIWYNRIAELNGAVTTAVFKVPMPSQYPLTMEQVYEKKRQFDSDIDPTEQYNPVLANKQKVDFKTRRQSQEADVLYQAYKAWEDGVATTTHSRSTGNVIIDTINLMFGTDGLYNMRKNTDVHPLAQLSALGKSLVDSSINNLGYAAIGGVSGALTKSFLQFTGKAGEVAAKFLISFAMVGLTIGFMLFYIVPFLPFIYFFFAFGGWIKGIFEAMVGAPLWALAHITIDGEGLPGKAAVSGYFLIFEIFLRPLLTIFGFIASITIFAAMVEVLNEIFKIVTQNVSGFDVSAEASAASGAGGGAAGTGPGIGDIAYYRSPVDEFFYTIIYAVIVYMLGMSSFKLIDTIPNSILRWMGQQVQTFGDQREDPAQNLLQYSQVGAQQGLQQLEGGLTKLTGAVSK